MKKTTKLGLFLAVLVCAAMLTAFVCSAAELSDINGHWAKEYIEYGVEKGYINGFEDGTFRPDQPVTRAQFSKIINSAVGITSTGSAKAAFKDVVAGEWYVEEVKKAENAGYITGYEDNTFRPSNTVTRQEAAVILSRIVVPTSSRADITSFGDGKAVDTWATDAVSMIAFKGYIKGDEKGNFNPKGQLTRCQAAKLVAEFVKNENIVNADQSVGNNEAEVVFSETLFTGDITVKYADVQDVAVFFKSCRVLGDINLEADGVFAQLENTKAKNVNINSQGASLKVDRACTVKNVNAYYQTSLDGAIFETINITGDKVGGREVKIDGTCQILNVNTDVLLKAGKVKTLNVTGKSNLVIQSADIETFNVEAAAKSSTINLLTKDAKIDVANNKAAVSYVGNGSIDTANNSVDGVSFDGVEVKTVTGKAAEGGTANADAFFKGVTITPKDKATKVAVDTKITLKFTKTVLTDEGDGMDETYLKKALKVRKGSETGSAISYDVKISSGKTITLTPTKDLEEGTKYYIVIAKNSLTYEDESTNDKFVSTFTTEGEEEDEASDEFAGMTVTPKNKATGVDVDTKITFKFDEKVLDEEGDALTTTSAKSIFELRKNTSTGTKVTCGIAVASNGKTVTLTPSKDLEEGVKYYVVIAAGKLTTDDGEENKKFTSYFTVGGEEDEDDEDEDEFLGMTVTPKNGKTGVAVTTSIVFNFDEKPYDSNGSSLSAADVEDSFQIRTKTSSGTKVDFTATIGNSGKKITLNPDDDLDEGTKYYVIIPSGALTDEDDNEISKFSSYFTTKGDDDDEDEDEDELFAGLTISPAKGKEISPTSSTTIKLTFDEKLTDEDEGTLTVDDIKDEIEIRKGSEDGTKVTGTFTVASTKKVITFKPTSTLSKNSKYYIIIPEGILTNEDGDSNDEIISYFTTTGYERPDSEFFDGVEFDPEDGELAKVSSNIIIEFEEEVFDDGKDKLTTSYMNDAFELRKGAENGTKVEFKATITSDNKKITINPSSNLDEKEIYYLIIPADTLKYEDKTENLKFVKTFTTPGYIDESEYPTIQIVSVEAREDGFKVVIKADQDGKVTVSAGGEAQIMEDYTKDSEEAFFIDGLEAGTAYTIKAEIVNKDGLKSTKSKNAETAEEEVDVPVCDNCGGEHETADCPEDDAPVCGNCGGEHETADCPEDDAPVCGTCGGAHETAEHPAE